jgi:hypothetical protein
MTKAKSMTSKAARPRQLRKKRLDLSMLRVFIRDIIRKSESLVCLLTNSNLDEKSAQSVSSSGNSPCLTINRVFYSRLIRIARFYRVSE